MPGIRARMWSTFFGLVTVAGVLAYVSFLAGRKAEVGSAVVAFGVGAALLAASMAFFARAIASACRSFGNECTRLADALVSGDFSTRADMTRVIPALRPALAQLDAGIAGLATSIVEIRGRLDRLARGDLPERCTIPYKNEVAALSDAVQRVTSAVEACVAEISVLASKAFGGKLSERGDPLRHEGDFRVVMEGLNATLDVTLMPVLEALGVLERLAKRDLSARVEGDHAGDHARLQGAVNATARQLQGALEQVAASVKQVSAAACEIASSSQSVANGASSQAASLEETAGQLETISATTRQVSQGADHTAALTVEVKDAAGKGAASMTEMTSTMSGIKQSAHDTAEIIKDINEIAFQTNLLALNAAVEAARAGEAGRGFAVVAEEVRALALRSKKAAAKTEELISTSVRQAESGEERVKLVNAHFQTITGKTAKVTEIAHELAAAAREQSAGIEQLRQAVGLVGNVTQQNAASSEQSSAAAAELSSQSQELAGLLGSFQLETGAAQAGTDETRALPQQVKAAIAAHGMWKTHLVAAIATGSATVKAEDAGHDDRCKFGKWLHGTPAVHTKTGYDEIRALHARFHRLAGEVLQLALAGDKEKARRLMQSTSEYTRTSAELTRALQHWVGMDDTQPRLMKKSAVAGCDGLQSPIAGVLTMRTASA